MFIPQNDSASSSLLDLSFFSSTHSHNKGPTGDWSSIIGIVTAIIGNVLISIALNTQRLAHIRLEREAQGEDPREDAHRHEPGRQEEDHQLRRQSKLANEISKRNKASNPVYEGDHIFTDEYRDHHETEPLLSKRDGYNDQRTSSTADEDEKDPGPHERQNYLRSKLWWIGISLMVVGEAGNFLAYGFAPASVVSPLGVVALISNCLIAPLMLHEKFRKRDLLGVVVAVGGAVAVVLSAKGSNPKLGPDQIWDLIERWEFLTYLGITIACIIVLIFLSGRYGHKTIIIDIGLVGLFGGYTALSTKGVASLLSYRLFDVFTFGIFYLLVAVLVGTAVMQIKHVNRALQHFDSTQVIPTQFCAFTIFVVAGSAILYRDFQSMTAAHIGQFFGGVALTFLGVWIITSGRSESGNVEDMHSDHEAEDQEIRMIDEETPASTPRPIISDAARESEPSTPKAKTDPPSPLDTPASFATATSQLTPNPALKSKPGMPTTQSSPFLPSQKLTKTTSATASSLAPPQTPSSAARPNTQSATSDYTPSTQTSAQPSNLATPSPRQLLSRNSFVGMLPGPYMSPLSSGLSVVVADSRRRGTLDRTTTSKGTTARRRSLRTSGPTDLSPGQLLSTSIPEESSSSGVTREPAAFAAALDPAFSSGEPGPSITERPRMGLRGNTVEVAGTGVRSGGGPGEEGQEEVESEEGSREFGLGLSRRDGR